MARPVPAGTSRFVVKIHGHAVLGDVQISHRNPRAIRSQAAPVNRKLNHPRASTACTVNGKVRVVGCGHRPHRPGRFGGVQPGRHDLAQRLRALRTGRSGRLGHTKLADCRPLRGGDLRSASNTVVRRLLTLRDDSWPDLMSTGCGRLPHIPRATQSPSRPRLAGPHRIPTSPCFRRAHHGKPTDETGLRGTRRHSRHDVDVGPLTSTYAGELGCHDGYEIMVLRDDGTSEKRKVGGSTPPLTTSSRSICQPGAPQPSTPFKPARSTDEKGSVKGERPSYASAVVVFAHGPDAGG